MLQFWSIVNGRDPILEQGQNQAVDGLGSEPWREWLRRVISTHGGPVQVARLSEVPKQTIDNYIHNRTKKPNFAHLQRIADTLDEQSSLSAALAVRSSSGPRPAVGLAEDAALFEGAPQPWPAKPSGDRGRWTVTSRVLELAGVLPGDICEFDFSVAPRPGDVVVTQLYLGDSAVTLLRLYRPPVLLAATADTRIDQAPILLDADGAAVNVRGPMVRLLRER